MNPLAQLKDIHAPTEVSWWPLAWGWWALGVMIIAVIVLAMLVIKKRRALLQGKKDAVDALNQLSLSGQDYAKNANAILKRFAMHYFADENPAGLHGKAWIEWLQSHNKKPQHQAALAEALTAITQAQYQASVAQLPEATTQTLCNFIRQCKVTKRSASLVREETQHV